MSKGITITGKILKVHQLFLEANGIMFITAWQMLPHHILLGAVVDLDQLESSEDDYCSTPSSKTLSLMAGDTSSVFLQIGSTV